MGTCNITSRSRSSEAKIGVLCKVLEDGWTRVKHLERSHSHTSHTVNSQNHPSSNWLQNCWQPSEPQVPNVHQLVSMDANSLAQRPRTTLSNPPKQDPTVPNQSSCTQAPDLSLVARACHWKTKLAKGFPGGILGQDIHGIYTSSHVLVTCHCREEWFC